MGGAGIMLIGDDTLRRSLCTTNEMSELIEQLEYSLGEGPCVDAYRQNRPVIEPDLVRPGTSRWPAFAPAAIEAGARAVFGFPLRVGAVRLGVLNLCRHQPGPLNDDQYANALVMADLAAEAALVLQASAARGKFAPQHGASPDFHDVVHKAAGGAAVQLDPSVGQQPGRLKAIGPVGVARARRGRGGRHLRGDRSGHRETLGRGRSRGL
jgi:hypothetical protein